MRITIENVRHKTKHLSQSFHNWLTILFKPDQFFIRVNAGEITNSFFPMALLALMIILQSIGQGAALGHLDQTTQSGFSLPAMVIFNLATLWITWLWVISIMRSFLILAGIRCPEWQPRVIVSWLFAPLTLRYGVRLIYTLITSTPIKTAGFSGFMSEPSGFIGIFISQILTQTDLYLCWQMILLWIGLKYLPSIQPGQRLMLLIITVSNMLIISSLIQSFFVFLQFL